MDSTRCGTDALVPQYWNDPGPIPVTAFGYCKEAFSLSKYSSRQKSSSGSRVLPEHIVIFETIWILEGHKSTGVYQLADGCYWPVRNVSIDAVDKTVLHDILHQFANIGSKLRCLYAYQADTALNYSASYVGERKSVTLEFAICVSLFCDYVHSVLSKIRSEIQNSMLHRRSYSLLQLHLDISSILPDLNFIHDLYTSLPKNTLADADNRFLEVILLESILCRFKHLWLSNDRTHGVIVWRVLSLAGLPHGYLHGLPRAELNGSGLYDDMTHCLTAALEEMKKDRESAKFSEEISTLPPQSRTADMHPLLRLHFSTPTLPERMNSS